MKKSIFKTLIVAILVVVLSLSSLLVACNDTTNPTTSGAIVVLADKTTVEKGDTVTLTVATNPKGAYTITTSHPDLTEIEGDKVKFVGDITEDTVVTITVTLDSDKNVKETKDITYKVSDVQGPSSVIVVVPDKTTAVKGDTVTLTVVTVPTGSYTITSSVPALTEITGNTVKFVGDITKDTVVTLTATLDSDPTVKQTTEITYKVNGGSQDNPSGAIVVLADKTSVLKGETVTLTIATNPKGPYTITTSAPELTEINGDRVKFVGDITANMVVTITVTLDSNPAVKETKDINFIAPYVPEPVSTIEITADKDTAVKGDVITLSVVTDPADAEYTIVTDRTDLVAIKGNEATFVGDITRDTFVIFKAILNEDSSIKDSVQVTFKAPTVEGQIGDLTSEMIKQIGNASITIQGTVEDIYQDFLNSMNDASESYDFKVMMEENKWFGQWNHQSLPEYLLVNTYRKSDEVVTSWKDLDGNIPEGNALLQLYINKNNQVAEKYVKNYESKYALWQNQHLWNHLSNLDVMTFEYDIESDLYVHTLDVKNETDLWLMTYLAYSLTPMLTDTLHQIAFKVEDGKIVSMIGETERLYTYNDNKVAENVSYTHFEANFSDVGSTIVPEPTPYEAPDNVDKLDAALEKIRNAESYTFNAVDNMTHAPSGDPGDYEMSAKSDVQLMSTSAKDYPSMTGTVGLVGQVTKDAILLAKTMKYDLVQEGQPPYRTYFSGYKQIDESSYDYFEYSVDGQVLVGKQKYFGNLVADRIPAFDFSSSIFSFEGSTSSKGVTYYTFAVRDSAINRDVAMEMSMHNYAVDSYAALDSGVRIIVDGNGNLISTSYPYSLSGVYFGTITTTFSKLNETVLPEDTFDGYVPRTWENTWDSFTCKYYTANPGVEPTHDENAGLVMTSVFGDKTLPTPTAFFEAFGDNWYGPFFDYTANGTDADGNTVYEYEISITAQVVDGLDENSKIEDYDAVFARIINAFAKEGYVKENRNSEGTNWLTLINETTDMQIVFENIGSAYFYINIYNLGDWTLND